MARKSDKLSGTSKHGQGNLVELVKHLSASEQAISAAAGQVDSIRLDDGSYYLLPQAREAIRQSEELFQHFMQYLPGVAFIKDMDGRFLFINAEWERVFGNTSEQVLGKTVRDLWSSEVADQTDSNDREVFRLKKSIQCIEVVPDKSKDIYWMVNKFPIFGKDGNISMLGAIALDITEQKKTALELEQTSLALAERVKELNCLNQVIMLLDNAEGDDSKQYQQIVQIIPAAMQYPELCSARLLVNGREYATPKFEVSENSIISHIGTDKASIGKIEVYYKEPQPGTSKDLFIPDEISLIKLIALKLHQFAERKSALSSLKESEQFAIGTLNGLSANIAIVDVTGKIIATNRAWNQFAENNSGNIASVSEGSNYISTCKAVSGPEKQMAEHFLQGMNDVIQGKNDEFVLEYPCHSPTEQRWFIARVTRFPGDGLAKIIVAHENITNQKLAELRLLRLNRIHDVLSGINSLIVRTTNRPSLFREACELAVNAGKFRMAWIGLWNPEDMAILPQTYAGHEAGYLDKLTKIYLTATNKDEFAINLAVKARLPVIRNNLASEQVVFPLKQEALARGYQAMATFPLLEGDKTSGVMVFYAAEADFFDTEEVTLLNELAGDISYALQNLLKQEKINYLISYDPLTQLPNREMFHTQLSRLLELSQPESIEISVLVCNINKFRRINNIYGQATSDMLLLQLVGILRKLAENPLYIARIVGDTFALICTRGQQEASRLFERLLGAFAAKPIKIKNHTLHITVTGGIASSPAHGNTAEMLFRNAEIAMENARHYDKPYMFFEQQMTASIVEESELQDALRNALTRNEFVLHYQPKIEMTTGRMVGVEALIRWNHPGKGLIPPFKFIPLLENSGLIFDVGIWIIQQAARDWNVWQQQFKITPTIAVNISYAQLKHRDFIDQFLNASEIMNNRFPLDIEVTESMLAYDIDDTISKLGEIKRHNIKVAVDDFGTGYSSLSYIAKLPIDYLKIDRSFINTMAEKPDSMSIVSTIITLAHSLNLKVIAEGVETEEQAKLLRLLRCDQAQGYLYSKPVPADTIREMLERDHRS